MWQTILGSLLALLLAGLLLRHYLRSAATQREEPGRLFAGVLSILDESEAKAGETAGTYVLTGRYRGHAVQVKVLADTLALRKLPSLWLMVTIPTPLPLGSTLDLMMRPAAVTSFSNFDHLDFTMETPDGFPDHLVIRSDAPRPALPLDLVARHLSPLRQPRGKELLISPKGLRLVMLLAEADRARYGVFRQADFGGAIVDAAQLRDALEHLMALRADILAWHDPPP
jgi:hypothetical protein